MSNIIDSIQLSGVTYTISGQSSGGSPTVELTQAEYDALVSAGTVSADTYYIITDSNIDYINSAQCQSQIDSSISGKADTSAVTEAINAAVSGKVSTSDFNAYSGATDTLINSKASQSDLNSLSGTVTAHTANTAIHVTSSEKQVWNAKSDFSGSYNDLTDKPTIPTSASQLTNDSGYITSGDAQSQIDSSISGKVDTSTYTAYTSTTATEIGGKASQSDLNSLSGTVTGHTANTTIHVTSSEKTTWSGKQDALVSGTNIKTINNESILGSGNITIQSEVSSAITSGDTNAVAGGAVYDKFDEVEQVTAAALNDINDRVSEDEEVTAAALNALNANKQGKLSAGTGIEISGNVISATGGGGGNPTVELTQAEYDALVSAGTVSADTYYIITDATPVDMSNYYTSAQTESAIAQAVSGKQDTLSAGRGISISSNVVSFDLPISAGTGADSIIEGSSTNFANGSFSHAEGYGTSATEYVAHSEGYYSKAYGQRSHAEGSNTKASGTGSHAEGASSLASGIYSHAEGSTTISSGLSSHAEGYYTTASTNYAHAEGDHTLASGNASHAEGAYTTTNNVSEHASGQYNVSSSASATFGDSGNTLFSVGNGTAENARHNAFEIRQNGDIYIVSGGTDIKLQDSLGGTISSAITRGDTNAVAGGAVYNRFNEVEQVTAQALNVLNESLSGKQDTLVSGTNIKTINNESILGSGNIDIQGGGKAIEAGRGISVTTGETADTVSFNLPISAGTGGGLVFIDTTNNVGGVGCVSIGRYCSANGTRTFAQGMNTQSAGYNSHSEGEYTYAQGNNSHSEGLQVYAKNANEHSQGKYNVSNKANNTWGDSGNTLFSVGNGTADNARHNAFEIRQNGDIYLTKDGQDVKLQDQLGGGGASYSAGTGIDITNDVISVTGMTDSSAFTAHTANTTVHTTAAEKTSWNGAATNASNAVTALGGLSLVKLTQAQYDALATKDNNTLYVIVN